LKRFVVDFALAYGRDKTEPAPRTRPEWVAVVGAGPAGLTAAHDLANMGYGVTIFEALPVAGGMMRVGIPAHRLPKGVLQQDIDDILDLGVVLKTNSPVHNPRELLDQGYNAVCLATGISTRDHSLGLDGEDAEGVIPAATFLRRINLGEPISIGDHVVVLGGGITALDAAAVARRLGSRNVTLALDRPRGELPAYHWEMAAVEAEGINLLEHVTATRIVTQNGKISGIELAKTGKGLTTDAQGRRRPIIEPGTEFSLDADTAIITIGQHSDLCFLDPQFDAMRGDPDTLESDTQGIFVVGGRKTGASFIIEAVALGHRVAQSIDRYLRNEPLPEIKPARLPVLKFSREELAERVLAGDVALQPRQEPALLTMEERVAGFREVVQSLTEHQARDEARRCLQCGICSECLACEYTCGTEAINHDMTETLEEIDIGAVILAPGYVPYQAELSGEYGLGRYPNVITSIQLERLLNASGPTRGEVRRPSDQAVPKKVAFLQCVGSRDTDHNYCSSVCCMYATKDAMLLKEHHPETEVHIFMMDVRAFSKGYEAYYQRSREKYGVEYIRCRVSALIEDPETRNVIVRHTTDAGSGPGDLDGNGSNRRYPKPFLLENAFDLVVLSVGMEISSSVKKLAQDLGIALDDYGFCSTPRFHPVETSRPGVFAVGPFIEPKDIPESVVDASAAAGVASGILASARGTLARQAHYPPERDISAESPRIGVFVCHCGSNIAGFLDVDQVTSYASRLPGVAHSEHLLYACSQDSTAVIQKRIEELELNRVVVASCTPLTHGPLFTEVIRQAGLNEHLFSMANIRNHCSWVHSDDEQAATEKAMDLVRMSVSRVAALEPLQRIPTPIHQSALVIGGGPAGMNSALTLADQGFPVYLVEKEAVLGGHLRHIQHDIQVPGSQDNVEPREYLEGLIESVERHERITTFLGSEVVESTGFVGHFTTRIRNHSGEEMELQHGATIVATGGQEYRGPEYGYGTHPRIITQGEFETLLASRADSQADTGRVPHVLDDVNQVVMIQCIGPAEHYCARTCCSIAIKNAIEIKRVHPSSQVIILHRDIRTYGFKERLYQEARKLGVIFIRYDSESKPNIEVSDGELRLDIVDPGLDVPVLLKPDILVLSTPVIPSEGSRSLASALKVPVDMDGWFLEAHVKLRPVEFASQGLFLAGTAHYPKLLNEAITQAQAAASRAAVILSHETISAGGAVAQVNPDVCVGCLTCARVCPFNVPVVTAERQGIGALGGAAYIEPSICQGCGTCVGECPANAIELLHYTHAQVENQVFSLFDTAGIG
jgi:heterodisulfide reductase subunit A-like polyferredoxin